MSRVIGFHDSSVGKKVVMAITGIVLVLFVIGHMAGNLKAFLGPAEFNAYAEGLRDFGHPLLPHMAALWIARVVLLAAVGLHIWAAWETTRQSRAARDVAYRKEESLSFSYASRTMRWGGVVIAAFVVYHILHFTTGQAHRDFVPGDAYHNLVAGFQNNLVVLAYVVAMTALVFHLYHGIWSTFQTLGLNHPKYNPYRRPLAMVVALIVYVGFLAVPLAVMAGILQPAG